MHCTVYFKKHLTCIGLPPPDNKNKSILLSLPSQNTHKKHGQSLTPARKPRTRQAGKMGECRCFLGELIDTKYIFETNYFLFIFSHFKVTRKANRERRERKRPQKVVATHTRSEKLCIYPHRARAKVEPRKRDRYSKAVARKHPHTHNSFIFKGGVSDKSY